MNIKFKNILKLIGSLLLITLVASFLFFTYKYITQSTKYKEYKAKVELVLKENESLTRQVEIFQSQLGILAKDKQKLLDDLTKKEVQIIEREKVIYIDGKLFVPADYNDLKNNYLILGENYELVKSMYASLLVQSKKDSQALQDSDAMIKKLTDENVKLLDLINNPVSKPNFFAQSVLIGIGMTSDNSKTYHVAYLVTIKDKIQLQLQANYPLSITALAGVKF